jgi:hypothetical protein
MVKTRSKNSDVAAPVPPAGKNRKRQTSNADEVQNKRTKIDEDESNNEQSKKKKGKGTKKKGKQPRYVATSSYFVPLNFFCRKTAAQRAAQDIAADAAGPPVHLPR